MIFKINLYVLTGDLGIIRYGARSFKDGPDDIYNSFKRKIIQGYILLFINLFVLGMNCIKPCFEGTDKVTKREHISTNGGVLKFSIV